MNKSTYIRIRLSEDDKMFLQIVAKKNSMSLSNYVLIAALNKARKDKK